MGRFEGKVGVVTGGGTGIGLACARAIVEGGGRVFLTGRREAVLRAAAEQLGPAADYVVCDVADDASVASAFANVEKTAGALHLAVNAAGTGTVGSVLNGPVSEFTRVLETNLTGAYRAMQHEARLMARSGGGKHRQHQLHCRDAYAPVDDGILRGQGGAEHADALRGGRPR